MFGTVGVPQLAIVAVVLVLMFGVGKLSGLGRDLGSGIKEFRRAMKEDEDGPEAPAAASPAAAAPTSVASAARPETEAQPTDNGGPKGGPQVF